VFVYAFSHCELYFLLHLDFGNPFVGCIAAMNQFHLAMVWTVKNMKNFEANSFFRPPLVVRGHVEWVEPASWPNGRIGYACKFCLCSLVGQLLNCRDVLIPEHTFLTSGSLPIKFLESFSSPSPFSIPFRLRVENSQTPPVIPFPLYFSENKKIKKMRPISIQRGIHVYLCNFKFLIRETSFTSLEVLVVLQP
jgi:hypothetical protein